MIKQELLHWNGTKKQPEEKMPKKRHKKLIEMQRFTQLHNQESHENIKPEAVSGMEVLLFKNKD